jgi:AcrR family transcriptional regulator
VTDRVNEHLSYALAVTDPRAGRRSKGPSRDAVQTRARLLAAATEEFSRYGIAGARVDRIAERAGSNKALIYHYFGSKDALFDAVFEQVVDRVMNEVVLDADDLGEYAGRLFDAYVRNPETKRLASWYRLERGETEAPMIERAVLGNKANAASIAAAQRAGKVSTVYSPEVVLGLVIHIAALWTAQTQEYDAITARISNRRRRQVVVSAVRAVLSE